MDNFKLYQDVSDIFSRIITKKYSTSFSSAINFLHKDIRQPIHNIYSFVRLTDEIVDTFHDFEKELLLDEFQKETYLSINRGISLNPIVNNFQKTVNKFNIELDLIDAFFYSMRLDLYKKDYNTDSYNKYIYGSAEVVGLMCLHVFCNGDKFMFEKLKPGARKLGSAFQKINFLRDIKYDYENLERNYFPQYNFRAFTENQKIEIEDEIQKDFDNALESILLLPSNSRAGVYVAYKYYFKLFRKIKNKTHHQILNKRIRIPDFVKLFILIKALLRHHFNLMT